jgi:MFS family permease
MKRGFIMKKGTRSFILIVISQIINAFGFFMLNFALSLYVLHITGSGELFGIMIALTFLPRIFGTPLGGAIADRFSKKRLLILYDSISVVIVVSMAILFITDNISLVTIGIGIFTFATVASFYDPVVFSSLPAILDPCDLPKANGIIQGVFTLSDLISSIIAGILFITLGVTNMIIICIIFFGLSVVIDFFLKIPYIRREMTDSLINTLKVDLKSGFAYMKKENPIFLRMAIVLGLVIFMYQSIVSVALPYIIRITYGLDESYFGYAKAIIGVALIGGGLAVNLFKKHLELSKVPAWLLLIALLTIPALVAVTPGILNLESIYVSYIILLAGFVLVAFTFVMINIMIMSQAQEKSKPELVGKVMAIMISITSLAMPFGSITTGFLLEMMSDRLYLIFAIVIFLTICVAGVTKKMKLLEIN